MTEVSIPARCRATGFQGQLASRRVVIRDVEDSVAADANTLAGADPLPTGAGGRSGSLSVLVPRVGFEPTLFSF